MGNLNGRVEDNVRNNIIGACEVTGINESGRKGIVCVKELKNVH